jgi:hypothetical protein
LKQPHEYNINPQTIQQLRKLKKDSKLMLTATDKNLGPAIMESSLYFKRFLNNHLLNQKQYAEISAEEAFKYDECNYRHILCITVLNPSGGGSTFMPLTLQTTS